MSLGLEREKKMAETTYTLKKVHTSSFTVLGNGMLRDTELALRERGLLATMLSLDDGWRFSVRGLASILYDGESAIKAALRILEAKGYLRRERLRDAQGRITAVLYQVSDAPVFLDTAALRTAEKIEAEEQRLQATLAAGEEEEPKESQLSFIFPAPEEPSEKTKSAASEESAEKMGNVEAPCELQKPTNAAEAKKAREAASKRLLVKVNETPSLAGTPSCIDVLQTKDGTTGRRNPKSRDRQKNRKKSIRKAGKEAAADEGRLLCGRSPPRERKYKGLPFGKKTGSGQTTRSKKQTRERCKMAAERKGRSHVAISQKNHEWAALWWANADN